MTEVFITKLRRKSVIKEKGLVPKYRCLGFYNLCHTEVHLIGLSTIALESYRIRNKRKLVNS